MIIPIIASAVTAATASVVGKKTQGTHSTDGAKTLKLLEVVSGSHPHTKSTPALAQTSKPSKIYVGSPPPPRTSRLRLDPGVFASMSRTITPTVETVDPELLAAPVIVEPKAKKPRKKRVAASTEPAAPEAPAVIEVDDVEVHLETMTASEPSQISTLLVDDSLSIVETSEEPSGAGTTIEASEAVFSVPADGDVAADQEA